jgi:hypothetical protein
MSYYPTKRSFEDLQGGGTPGHDAVGAAVEYEVDLVAFRWRKETQALVWVV